MRSMVSYESWILLVVGHMNTRVSIPTTDRRCYTCYERVGMGNSGTMPNVLNIRGLPPIPKKWPKGLGKEWKNKSPTKKQAQFLRKEGYDVPATRGRASKKIGKIISEKEHFAMDLYDDLDLHWDIL